MSIVKDVPPAMEPSLAPHAHYMQPLDGIRGMACMLVILSHVAMILDLSFKPISPYIGAVGVVIFFGLSGFLMSTLYADQKFSFNAGAKYMIARMARIAPAYWIAIIFAWCIYQFILPGFHYQMYPFMMLRSVFFGGNQGVFWSIPPEVQFYVFFLLLWFSWGQMKKGSPWWALATAILCSVFIATCTLWGGLTLPSKLHIFLLGFLAAFLPKNPKIKGVIGTVPFQAVITVITVAYGILYVSRANVYTDLVFPSLVVLWLASMSSSTILTKPFESATMRMIGAASFSIYLFHDPILFLMYDLGFFVHTATMVTIAIMSIVSLALPVTFHFLVEKRLNKTARASGLICLDYIEMKLPFLRGKPQTQA